VVLELCNISCRARHMLTGWLERAAVAAFQCCASCVSHAAHVQVIGGLRSAALVACMQHAYVHCCSAGWSCTSWVWCFQRPVAAWHGRAAVAQLPAAPSCFAASLAHVAAVWPVSSACMRQSLPRHDPSDDLSVSAALVQYCASVGQPNQVICGCARAACGLWRCRRGMPGAWHDQ
jgi:hypothetical protein